MQALGLVLVFVCIARVNMCRTARKPVADCKYLRDSRWVLVMAQLRREVRVACWEALQYLLQALSIVLPSR